MIKAVMRLVACAFTLTSDTARMALSSTLANTSPRITFRADAPAPLTPTPAAPPKPAPTEAAQALTVMLALELPLTSTVPLASSCAPRKLASTTVSMMLRDKETPIETATPAEPPNEAAMEAAPAWASTRESSSARMLTLCTAMRLGRVPDAVCVSAPA